MIELTVKGLADYVMKGPAAQRKTLHDFKYPDDNEAAVRTLYYRHARDAVRAYHRECRPAGWLLKKAELLRLNANSQTHRSQTRLDHNARALEQYHRHFGTKKFEYQSPLHLEAAFGQVRIKVSPDLHVIEKKRARIIRVEFSTGTPQSDRSRLFNIVGQIMFEATRRAGLGMTNADVLCYDVTTGKIHKGKGFRSRMRAEIEAACKNIEAVWPGLER